jgi:CHAT domain-containing protein
MTAQAEVLEVLAWIWDTITEPVLTALGHTTTPSPEESWPRVWWSPVGVLVYLPMHAAGHHSDLTASGPTRAVNPRTTLDRVISSYTTTVRSLAYARTHHPGAGNGKAVVVAVPDAPDTPPLPGVTAETTTLTRLLPDVLVLANPTRDTVLAALPTHQVAHFACHGYADWNDPASSRLILRDHHTAPLTVADVSALHLTGGLAYLSACDTTVNSPRLADEAVHLAGAFHLAGYQHVIGTLWPINDALARYIAEDFYVGLTAGGTTVPQTSLSARALHHAIRRLRARYPQAPTLWAAHTHTGA